MSSAQVASHFFEQRDALRSFPALQQARAGTISSAIATKTMPTVDVAALLAEDAANAALEDIPFRFGYGFDVNYTLADGTWQEQEEQRIWRLKFSSSGAYSLNFIFSELQLIPGAELYIFNPDGRMVYGPITEAQNIPDGFSQFLTDLVAGSEVIMQLSEPAASDETSVLRISRVVHGYVDMFSALHSDMGQDVALQSAAYSCHNDVACYPAWEDESNGVALILRSNGTSLCTGSLLNNTAQDNKPFFLTAFHCIDDDDDPYALSPAEKNKAQDWAFRFKYKKATCNGSTVSSYITYNYAHFRSAWQPTDFALMELVNPVAHSDAKFLGWDRNGNTPLSGTGIHHPAGDVMKISFDNNGLISTGAISWRDGSASPSNSHWVVGFDNGTMEGGSSGSPLFDKNKRVIGQLHGGMNGCAPVTKYYGKFSLSWTGGGTNDTRLSNWLDPNNTRYSVVNTAGLITLSGAATICTTPATYTLSAGSASSWSVIPESAFSLMSTYTGRAGVKALNYSGTSGTLTAIVGGAPVTKVISTCRPSITGSDTICASSATYTLPNGIGAFWSIQPSNAFQVTPSYSSNSVTVRATINDAIQGTLTATINDIPIVKVISSCHIDIVGEDTICGNSNIYTLSAGTVSHWTARGLFTVVSSNDTSALVRATSNTDTSGTLIAIVNGVEVTNGIQSCRIDIAGLDTVCGVDAMYTLPDGNTASSWSITGPFSIVDTSATSVIIRASSYTGSQGTLTAIVNEVARTKLIRACELSIEVADTLCPTAVYALSNPALSAEWSATGPYSVTPDTGRSVLVQTTTAATATGTLTAVVNGVPLTQTITSCEIAITGDSLICPAGSYTMPASSTWALTGENSGEFDLIVADDSTSAIVAVNPGFYIAGQPATLTATAGAVTVSKTIQPCTLSITGGATVGGTMTMIPYSHCTDTFRIAGVPPDAPVQWTTSACHTYFSATGQSYVFNKRAPAGNASTYCGPSATLNAAFTTTVNGQPRTYYVPPKTVDIENTLSRLTVFGVFEIDDNTGGLSTIPPSPLTSGPIGYYQLRAGGLFKVALIKPYHWEIYSPDRSQYVIEGDYRTGADKPVVYFPCPGTYRISLQVHDGCWWSPKQRLTFTAYPYYIAYPNPTSDRLAIERSEKQSSLLDLFGKS
jgi:hypothetical protein